MNETKSGEEKKQNLVSKSLQGKSIVLFLKISWLIPIFCVVDSIQLIQTNLAEKLFYIYK